MSPAQRRRSWPRFQVDDAKKAHAVQGSGRGFPPDISLLGGYSLTLVEGKFAHLLLLEKRNYVDIIFLKRLQTICKNGKIPNSFLINKSCQIHLCNFFHPFPFPPIFAEAQT